jgi:serine-type D-Ala-D-Ala carboxypeptidase (penicillin-binding protein 5/6)
LEKTATQWNQLSFSAHLSVFLALLMGGAFFLSQSSIVHAASFDPSPPPTVSAPYAYLFDLRHHKELLAKAATTETEIASTTKIMTALLVIESGKLNRPITIKQAYIDYVNENDASNAGLQVNDRLTVKQLLYALMLPSGCDAAYALADVLGNGVPNFVAKMNREVAKLHLSQTYYVNADGLHNPDSQGKYGYSTAADLARLTRYAMRQPLFRQVVNTQTYSVPATSAHHAYTWTNTNELLSTYQEAIGVKTGTTSWAGYCLVFAAKRNREILLGVVLASTSSDQRYADATALLNWGFSLTADTQIPQAA